MSLTAAFAFAALMAGDPQAASKQVAPPSNHRVIGPDVNGRHGNMANWYDNERRVFIEDARRRISAGDHLRRVRDERFTLADDLDGLIGAGRCDEAREAAAASRHKDIAGEVERVCAARSVR
jgi:hypothetical protein